jgi:DNA-binding LacI/PurR family transcriptional regulator
MENLPFSPLVGATSFAMSEEFSANGLTLLLVPWASKRQPLTSLIATLAPAAIITVEPLSRADIRTARRFGVPLVTVASGSEPEPALGDTYRSVGRLQGAEMIGMGYGRLVVALPTNPQQLAGARIRMAGVADACEQAGLPAPDAISLGSDLDHAEQVIAALDLDVKRTGICAYDDDVALTVIGAAARAGIGIPDEFGLIGVDDTQAGRVAVPALTTIAWDGEAIAKRSAAEVLQKLGLPTADNQAVPSELIHVIRRASA